MSEGPTEHLGVTVQQNQKSGSIDQPCQTHQEGTLFKEGEEDKFNEKKTVDNVTIRNARELINKGNDAYTLSDWETAVCYYKQAENLTTSGHVLYRLGVMYKKGHYFKKESEIASQYFQKALQNLKTEIEQDNPEVQPEAQCDLGYMYLSGYCVEKDYNEAVRLFRLSADKGHVRGQINYGYMLLNGFGVEPNREIAIKYYSLAADQGHSDAQTSFGYVYEHVLKDPEMAFKYYKLAADSGHTGAQTSVAAMYEKGTGIEEDKSMAIKYYRLAADKGNINAQTSLAYMYANAEGIERDYKMALQYNLLAAEKDDDFALANLGYMYEHGCGVVSDHKIALKYYLRAAEKNNAFSQMSVGYLYEHGLGVEKDTTMAVKYYRLAVKNGDPRGHYHLAYVYENGISVTQDFKLAAQYYLLAAYKEDKEALEELSAICRSVCRREFKRITVEHLGSEWPKSHQFLQKDCQKAVIEFASITRTFSSVFILPELVCLAVRWIVVVWPGIHVDTSKSCNKIDF